MQALLQLALMATVAAPSDGQSSWVDEPTAWTEDNAAEEPKPTVRLGAWSTDLLDPDGLGRAHLVTRAMFADGSSAFSGSSAWSYEVRAHLRLVRGLALSAVLPVGLSAPEGGDARVFIGNVALGVGAGTEVVATEAFRVRLGGGLDVYAPSSPARKGPRVLRDQVVSAMRAYEPQLYLPELFAVRARAHADLTLEPVTLELELGLVPGTTVGARGEFVLLLSAAGRVSARLGTVLEPYLEAGYSPQIAGKGDVSPPVLVTPGLRFHIADAFDPAVFVSLNFVTSSAIIFGLDLAAVIRPSTTAERVRRRRESEFDGF